MSASTTPIRSRERASLCCNEIALHDKASAVAAPTSVGSFVPRPAGQRLEAIDAARGLAMIFVCLSHFGEIHLDGTRGGAAGALLDALGRVATPSFMVISGALIGFRHASDPASFAHLKQHLVDRALFLLTVAHLVIVAAYVPHYGLRASLRGTVVTDAIGVAILVGVWLVPRTTARQRALLGLVAYLTASLCALAWWPDPGSPTGLVKHVFVGFREGAEPSFFIYVFPLVQWSAVYLAGTVLGEVLLANPSRSAQARRLALLGIALFSAAALCRVLVGRSLGIAALRDPRSLAHFVAVPGAKLPPGPAFLALYGGCALLLLAGALTVEGLWPRLLAPFEIVGRNSLFFYVGQYLVYYSVFPVLHLPVTNAWPLLLLATMGLLYCATTLWEAAGGKRWLSVGYPWLRDREHA